MDLTQIYYYSIKSNDHEKETISWAAVPSVVCTVRPRRRKLCWKMKKQIAIEMVSADEYLY